MKRKRRSKGDRQEEKESEEREWMKGRREERPRAHHQSLVQCLGIS